MKKRFETRSAGETLSLGEKIGQCLRAGDVILLFGDLGAGKTTLTQGIARGLEVPQNEYVRSPTFTLVNQYRGKLPVFHIDLYRVTSPNELEDLGLEEIFEGEGVVIVEWAEKLFQGKNLKTPLLGIQRWIEIHIQLEPGDNRIWVIKSRNLDPIQHPVFTLH